MVTSRSLTECTTDTFQLLLPLLSALSSAGWRGSDGRMRVEVLHPAVGGLPFLQ